ncbi:hypothetical protein C1H46_014027 [Malus baccata]|uniref:Uncharacterized protein n=1 Tax=Malus baccata TaxID=106549 RepID=A0A540MPI4_MALBA|nr:hypothetical protein C1H46_014027 [Malus baccata]
MSSVQRQSSSGSDGSATVDEKKRKRMLSNRSLRPIRIPIDPTGPRRWTRRRGRGCCPTVKPRGVRG